MDLFKQKVAGFLIKSRIKRRSFNNQSFTSIIINAKTFLVLMPEDDKDFQYALTVLEHLEHNNKAFFIITYDYRVSTLPFKYRSKSLAHGIKDVNRINLPSKRFLASLEKKNFDAVIDLNRKEQMLYIYISCAVNARVSIGFTKNFSDQIYNLQIANNEINPKLSYENLLTCLKML